MAILAALGAIACRDDELTGPQTAPVSPPSFLISPGTGNECRFAQVRSFDGIGFAAGVDASTACNTFGSITPASPIYFNPDVSIAYISVDENDPMGVVQGGPVTFRFQRPILNPVVIASGNMKCASPGEAIAYLSSGGSARVSFRFSDPGDCGEDDMTCCMDTPPIVLDAPVDSVVVTPPGPLQWVFTHHDFICDIDNRNCIPNDWDEDVFAHVGYTVYFREPPTTTVSVNILSAAGPNPAGSFTSAFGENRLTLEATVTPPDQSGQTTWVIVDDPDDQVGTLPPSSTNPGLGSLVEATVPTQDGNRWASVTHADRLNRKSLSLLVTAVVLTAQGPVQSTSVKITQDEIDTMREEYQELGKLHFPDRRSVGASSSNTGDYTVAVINIDFDSRLETLHQLWVATGLGWSISSYFRNPVHNDYHITPKGAQESWHQYGCAADIRTTHLSDPPTIAELKDARDFWNQLAKLARQRGFWVEPLKLPDHVHVQRTCF